MIYNCWHISLSLPVKAFESFLKSKKSDLATNQLQGIFEMFAAATSLLQPS